MWSTLESIRPATSLDEALELATRPGHRLVGGGGYLADQRPAEVHTLVSIAGLLDHELTIHDGVLMAGAGASLAELHQLALRLDINALAEALEADTPQPNLRHQRLLGGALATGLATTPLVALCLAGSARVRCHGVPEAVELVDWDGSGLVTALELPLKGLAFAGLSRLPASPPWLFAACGFDEDGVRAVAGAHGVTLTLAGLALDAARPLSRLAPHLSGQFRDDSLGSIAYKTRVLGVLLEELEVRSWK